MQFRPARPRARPAQTFCARRPPPSSSSELPAGARSGLLGCFCAAPRRPARPAQTFCADLPEPARACSEAFAHRPLRPARARNSPPEPARACSEAFAHRPPECTLGFWPRSKLFSISRSQMFMNDLDAATGGCSEVCAPSLFWGTRARPCSSRPKRASFTISKLLRTSLPARARAKLLPLEQEGRPSKVCARDRACGRAELHRSVMGLVPPASQLTPSPAICPKRKRA